MRRIALTSFMTVALASAGCSSDPVDLDTSGVSSTEASSATITTEANDFDDNDELPREGSVADTENPIAILEDGLTFDPEWRADITLTCGPDSETRTIAVFDVNTNDRGSATLYQQTPSGGGFAAEPAAVGSVVPVDVDLAWSIPGILLGPWRVDTITDACSNE